MQLALRFRTWGGRRAGAGRKPGGERSGVPHRRRSPLNGRHPLHVTMRLKSGLPTLRQKALARVVFGAFAEAKEKFGTRVVQFSVQSNHLHLLVEAADALAFARAMKGLAVRLARRINRKVRRRGRVFSDRYHARALKTPREVRLALIYVLRNHHRHSTGAGRPAAFDAFSSAAYFDGFTRGVPRWPRHGFAPSKGSPVARAETWLLRHGWRRLGLIGLRDVPARD